MKQLDLFYRAFNEYKAHTKANVECRKFQNVSAGLNKLDQQNLCAVFTTCTIKEDWIEAIEKGLPYIVKAIKEERQFIRNDGEITPIEKVRKTSKASIQDLAKHSNYISHEAPEGVTVDVLPDKLLIIKKENDYAVYENRVLYATLLYLQEFIGFRLNKLKEISNKYEANAKINKKIVIGNRTLNFNLDMNEVIKEDPIASTKNDYIDLIKRIEDIYSNVLSLLRMPLIVEVSKVDVVTRPITKTNVLKMDINFKEALSLFDFIAEYQGDGFEVHTISKSFNPLNLEIVTDYTEIMMLTSFVTYLHTNGLVQDLDKAYKLQLEQERELEERKILERVKHIDLKAQTEGKTLQEYVYVLDEANKLLKKKTLELTKKVEELTEKHIKEVNLLNENHEIEVNEINHKHENDVNSLNNLHEEEVAQLTKEYEEKISNLEATIKQQQIDFEAESKRLANEYKTKEDELVHECENKVAEANKARELAQGELMSIRLSQGSTVNADDFTSEERFKELDREIKYLQEFYNKAWKATKKQIKKEVFSVKPQKGKKK